MNIVRDPNPSVRMKGEMALAQIIKKNVLNRELSLDRLTEDIFCFGRFINPKADDLAVGISTPPYGGYLIVLTQKNGHYVPVPHVGIGFIQSIERVKLLSGDLEQIVLDLYSGGSGLRHWGKDIYCWDGEAMRMIWTWVRKEKIEGIRKTSGHIIQSDIFFEKARGGGPGEIITSTTVEKGILDLDSWELAKVTSSSKTKQVHRWDQSLFFYVPEYGRILPPQVTVSCRQGIPQKKTLVTLKEGTTIGILDIPCCKQAQSHMGVIGKEHFCEIPEPFIKVLSNNEVKGPAVD